MIKSDRLLKAVGSGVVFEGDGAAARGERARAELASLPGEQAAFLGDAEVHAGGEALVALEYRGPELGQVERVARREWLVAEKLLEEGELARKIRHREREGAVQRALERLALRRHGEHVDAPEAIHDFWAVV